MSHREASFRAASVPFHPNADVIRREKAEKAAAAAAQQKKNRTYSDGGYRISKRSPEAARTELIVANALRYAEDLKKKRGENPAGTGGDAAIKAWSASALSLLSACACVCVRVQ